MIKFNMHLTLIFQKKISLIILVRYAIDMIGRTTIAITEVRENMVIIDDELYRFGNRKNRVRNIIGLRKRCLVSCTSTVVYAIQWFFRRTIRNVKSHHDLWPLQQYGMLKRVF
jgi:hypothetical protein